MKFYNILWNENPDINQKISNAYDQIESHNKIFPYYDRTVDYKRPADYKKLLGFKFSNDLEYKIMKILKKSKMIEYFKERITVE